MFFEELSVGLTAEITPVIIEKDKMLEFALKYDNVPIHVDEEYAKTTPFKALLAPGVMTFLEVWAKYLEKDFFGEELLAGKSTKIEWEKPVFAGDTLRGIAKITNLSPRNEKNGIAELTIDVFNEQGERVLVSTTEAIVKRKIK